MFTTRDPRLGAVITERVLSYGRKPGSYEYQMLDGIRPDEQRRLVNSGEAVRVYVPYGEQRYCYPMGQLAKRPANTAFSPPFLAGGS